MEMGCIREYLDRVPEEILWQEYLEHCLRGIRPYGCRKYFGIKSGTEYIGTIKDGKWLRDIYEDEDGNYWFTYRVMVGRWTITLSECLRGRKDPCDPYEEHTGIRSDWEKVWKKYGGVPAGWERIRPEDQEDEDGDDKDNTVHAAAFGRSEDCKKAV